jgi:hypothetical protein
MPRYFFHLYNDLVALDEEGAELPDLEAARTHAIRNIRELMCEELLKGHLNFGHRIEVADDRWERVLTVPYSEAVTVTGIVE